MEAGLSDLRGQTTSQNPAAIFSCAGGHSGPPLRGGFVSLNGRIEAVNRFSTSVSKPNTNKRDIAMHGGMWSGWAASRTGQRSDTESQLTFGGW
jgi:hypothetical protein